MNKQKTTLEADRYESPRIRTRMICVKPIMSSPELTGSSIDDMENDDVDDWN